MTSDKATTCTHWVAGNRVKVRQAGDGPPLLLIMGIGGSVDMWEPLEKVFPNRRLVMFDFPGTGSSGPALFPPTIPHAALFTRLVLRRLRLGPVDVLGYSWGGLVAQQLAIQHRRVVRKLVLACTSYGLGSIPPRPHVALTMGTPRRYYSAKHFTKIAAETFGGSFRTDTDLIEAEAGRRLGRPPTIGGYLWQVLASASYSSLPLLPTLGAETLVLGGDDDPIIRTANQRILGRAIPQARVEIVSRAGHLLLLERPDVAAGIIESFLRDQHA